MVSLRDLQSDLQYSPQIVVYAHSGFRGFGHNKFKAFQGRFQQIFKAGGRSDRRSLVNALFNKLTSSSETVRHCTENCGSEHTTPDIDMSEHWQTLQEI